MQQLAHDAAQDASCEDHPKETRMQQAAWLWLAAALGPAAANSAEVLRVFPQADALSQACRSEDLSPYFTPAQLEILRNTRPEDHLARLDDCARLGVGVVTWQDAVRYPALLRAVSCPPPVLYYRGDITIPNRSFLFAIVGTRRPSAYGVEATAAIAGALARAGVVLVSGLATGLDSESHKAAIQAGTPTVACIAFGHDECYPAANRKLKEVIERQGLVLSEYPPGTPPLKHQFLQRNRLIAGLSHGLCVAEARRYSGTMNTVSAALAAGRDVFSVPGSIFSPLCEGTNHLLCEGAIPAVCGADILQRYGFVQDEHPEPAAAAPEEPELGADAACVRKALSASPLTMEALCEKTGFSPHRAMAALMELEFAGLSQPLAGHQFQLK